jgi:hypothetical protein
MRRSLFPLAAAAVLALPLPCAAGTYLGLGADYLSDDRGLFQLTLAVDTPVARPLAVGGRFGALIANGPVYGVPTDLFLRLELGRVYCDGLVGPWFFFSNGDAVRLHGAIGFGLQTRGLTFGLEVGSLGGAGGMIGARLGLRI